MLGSEKKGETYVFNTYAPHAKKIELYIGDNNYPMNVNKGIWSTTVEVKDNVVYSYIIDGVRKCDPFARKIIEFNKGNPESVTYNSTYVYKNKKQIREVVKIYEVYLKNIQGKTYQEKANTIIKNAEVIDVYQGDNLVENLALLPPPLPVLIIPSTNVLATYLPSAVNQNLTNLISDFFGLTPEPPQTGQTTSLVLAPQVLLILPFVHFSPATA
jgi:hypothetical protein